MFKATSDNSQFRQRNAALDERKNAHGIDGDVFKGSEISEREKIVAEKRGLELKLGKLKNQIAIAGHRFATKAPGQISHRQFMMWKADHAAVAARLTELNGRLFDLNMAQKAVNARSAVQRQRDTLEFAECFKKMARELLVEDVYNRIITATIHRMAEGGDKP